ncbi:MAG: NigD-like N-terminal domain-containing protein [Prevotella sp.]|nr:NigD-like N-terminal domain-containing protein [Prevotella sp.]
MKKLIYAAILLLVACQTDSYDKGEGQYSLMQGDFADLIIDGQKQGVSFQTDEGDSYQLVPPYTAKWIATADTTYRAIIYYNKVADHQAEPVAVGTVVTLTPIEHWRYKEQPQDPLGFESAWIAKNGKYLNLGLLMKTGRIDDEELPHNIGLAQDTVMVNADNTRTAYYRLLHSQNGIPQYYTNRRYVSILLPQALPDTIHFQLETYEGTVKKTFIP